QLLGGGAHAHRRGERGARLEPAQAGFRDGGRPGAGDATPHSPDRRGAPGSRLHDHGARGRRPSGGGREDRSLDDVGAGRRSRLIRRQPKPRRTTMPGTMVDFPSNGGTTKGYLATPASGKGPGILVIQEWWGLVRHIKNVCDRFAAEGFTSLAPDMYHGQSASEPDGAGKLFMALNIAQAEKDLRGAATYLARQSSSQKLGAVGFCMGGQLALFAATVNANVGATVNFYGIHPNVKPDYSKLSGPVLGLFAEKDSFVTP